MLSFRYAWQGCVYLFRYEHNAWIHLVAMVGVIVAGILFKISLIEWCLVLLCIGSVISSEAVNSSIEALADRITEEKDPLIGRAKDLSAFAVLFFAIISIIIGLIIFVPKVF